MPIVPNRRAGRRPVLRRIAARFIALSPLVAACLSGCAVVAVADAVGTVAVKTAGVAADAAVGTVKVAGKVVGKAADAVVGGGDPPK